MWALSDSSYQLNVFSTTCGLADDGLKTKKSSLRHASRAQTARTVVKGIIGELGRLIVQENNMT
jgi:hypothetical protein